jgi:hypothetical protein
MRGNAFFAAGLLALWGCQAKIADPATASRAAPTATGATAAVGSNGAAAGDGNAATNGAALPGAPQDCSLQMPAPRRLWRLTATQYDNTLKDLLGTDASYGSGFPADDVGVGFGNGADTLLMSPLLADKLQSAAEDIANSMQLNRFAPCAPADSAAGDDKCLRELVTRFGTRAFRRPLKAAEVDTYFGLAKQAGAFDAGARMVVTAMLQSPSFLYRSELGHASAAAPGVYELDDYEIASELSYLLWQSMPDDALMQAAERGELRDLKQRQAQVARMLKVERARPVFRKFVFDWLGLSEIMSVPKDSTRYPELSADIRAALSQEAERFVDNVMLGEDAEHDGSIRALLGADTTFLDDKLAAFYGVPAASGGNGVQLSAQERRGILTLGGVLLTHSRSNDSSPIHRGKLVREKLLCHPLPPPPPGLVLQPPGLDPSKTARERYAAHSENAFCQNCHKLMDPIGLAFEHYDGIGRYRPDDNGLPIDPSGEVVPNDREVQHSDADGPFANLAELTDQLMNSKDVESCYALEWFRFAYGEGKTERDGEAYPSCQAKRFQAAINGTGGSLKEIVAALAQSDWFLTRSGNPNPVSAEPESMQPPADNTAGKAAEADAGAPAMTTPDGVAMELTVDNDWGMGYCHTYQLRNTTSAPITWSVPLDVRGTMNNHWECKVTADSGMVVFTGEDHNKTIEPNGMAQFGFCAVVSSN